MFKNFHGFGMFEQYQAWKRERRERKSFRYRLSVTAIKLIIIISCTFIMLFLPAASLGIPDLTLVEQRVIAIFVFATLMWLLEPVPAWTTSMGIVVLLLLTCSDSSLWFMRNELPNQSMGEFIHYKSILNSFSDPIIMLFIGGFIMAIATSKSGLDATLAKVMLKPFGTQSRFVLLGFILLTAWFSMFISNTATAAMMLTFLTPVMKSLPADGKGKIALAMSIPIAANLGGIGTPIGTPPNAIALRYLNNPDGLNMNIGFGEWMMVMFPFVIVVLLIAWVLLLNIFPFKQKKIVLNIQHEHKQTWRDWVVYITFCVTVSMWVLDKYTGVNANAVAMIPVAVFALTGIIGKRDLEELNWSVLWMVAGGFALGVALEESGLALHLINAIPFDTWPALAIIIGSGLLCYILSNFISNTATATLLVPILAIVGTSMGDQLNHLGGISTLLIGIALSSSMAMLLPISTPPNAMAHSTGFISQKDMMKAGLIMGVIGLVLGYLMLIVLGSHGLL